MLSINGHLPAQQSSVASLSSGSLIVKDFVNLAIHKGVLRGPGLCLLFRLLMCYLSISGGVETMDTKSHLDDTLLERCHHSL